jgi:hypothetical protein
MITLTVDPSVFPVASEAFAYLREKRCVTEFIRRLRKRGVLHSHRHIFVYDFHKNGHPHVHLVVDASWIAHADLQALWDGRGPKCRNVKGKQKKRLGHVNVSRPKIADRSKWARYAAEYLFKLPDEWPEWVLQMGGANGGRFRRYSKSRYLWTTGKCKKSKPEENESTTSDVPRRRGPARAPSYGNVTEACGRTQALLRVRTLRDDDDVVQKSWRWWIADIQMTRLQDAAGPAQLNQAIHRYGKDAQSVLCSVESELAAHVEVLNFHPAERDGLGQYLPPQQPGPDTQVLDGPRYQDRNQMYQHGVEPHRQESAAAAEEMAPPMPPRHLLSDWYGPACTGPDVPEEDDPVDGDDDYWVDVDEDDLGEDVDDGFWMDDEDEDPWKDIEARWEDYEMA